MTKKRPRRTYTDEFKEQVVQLYLNGKRKCDIIREYDLAASLLDKWIKQSQTTGSFKEKDNRSELENVLIDATLEAFDIDRSLSMKGCPYDNAVAEATYKIIKTEFVKNRVFSSLGELKIELSNYVNWFNNHRIHSSLGYLTPREFKENTLKKVV